jgi:ribosomal protein L18
MVNVMVRTHDNKRLKIRISGNATVNQFAAQVLREGGNSDRSLRFTLSAGFPPKELTDGNATVSSAGLAGASVTMKKI